MWILGTLTSVHAKRFLRSKVKQSKFTGDDGGDANLDEMVKEALQRR